MVEMVCSNFSDVVVVYNGANQFELGFVEEYEQIKAAVWCLGTGNVGFNALGKVLRGEVNPSGRTPDTFMYDKEAAPWWNNGHGFMNADAALANGVDAMLSTYDGEENNVANPEHPTSVLQMRNACKNVMYTVVSSWAYDDGNVDVGMEDWKKVAIAIDAVLALGLLALEAVVLKGYKKRRA